LHRSTTNCVVNELFEKGKVMTPEHPPIKAPSVKQLMLTLVMFVFAMLLGNAFLLALESQLGLYSYLGHPQLKLLESPLQWLNALL
jgi:hypothetical protein